MKNKHFRDLFLLNLGMLCISTSGAIGRYLHLSPPLSIWYRSVFALFFLGLFCWWKKYQFRFDFKKDGGTILLAGVLMTTHWVTYFYALQWSNVAIAMLSLFTYPIFTALLEPLFFKTRLQMRHVLLSVVILVGIYFLAPTFDIKDGSTQGLLMGLLSSLSYAIRNIILKKKIDHFNGSMLLFYQMVIMMALLWPALLVYSEETVVDQLPYLVFLGLITTSVGHTLFLNSFRSFSISAVSILGSMQPIFGIIIAIIFLHEMPSGRNMIGGALILLTVLIESQQSAKKSA